MKIWIVDAFSNKIFHGNPAAVVIDQEQQLNARAMQLIAQEMNLSETAFVQSDQSTWGIRWFTPNSEVNLCGHATLAAAHILWQERLVEESELIFSSRSGPLAVSKNSNNYTLNFPAQVAVQQPERVSEIQRILGVPVAEVFSNGEDCVVSVSSNSDLSNCQPDLTAIAALPERGLTITCQDATCKYDYLYRAFFPKLGVPEDPVTGSVNTALVPLWSTKLGRSKMKAFQCSPRGGELWTELNGNRVLITGQAVTVMQGKLSIGTE